MNKVRGSMTVFCLAVLSVTFLGWRWSAVLPPAKQQPARVVLALAALAAVAAIAVLWTSKTEEPA